MSYPHETRKSLISRQEWPGGRILGPPMRRRFNPVTLDYRARQLHDEAKSGGIQPAYIRVIDRR